MTGTVVIVDDHAGFRTQASQLLAAGGYRVLATCADGRSALGAIAGLRPELVLLDVQLPDLDGFAVMAEAARTARRDEPGWPGEPQDAWLAPVFVLISTREEGDYGGRVARSGAAGFISKAELSLRSLAAVVGGATRPTSPILPVARP